VSVERLIAQQRLITPAEHLEILIEPPAQTLPALAAADRTARLRAAPLLDTSVAELRQQLRQRLELPAPVILTGHQVEFVHAGVFAKTIAAAALAARLNTTGVYMSVDFDLPKATRLVVPRAVEGEVQRHAVAIPGCDPRLPAEWQAPVPVGQWQAFFERLAALNGRDDSLLPRCAADLRGTPDVALTLSDVVERGQIAVSRALGLAGQRRVRASQLSRMLEFRALLAHSMLHAGDFVEHYNQAQRAYRARRRVRNPHRPVRLLAIDEDRFELPFWIGRRGQPRRRLAVARKGGQVVLFAGQEAVGAERTARLQSAASHAEPWQVEQDGWQLRPRALLLSAFARLFLSDLFIHGIGGAKYDEMTEDFVRRFFGVDLPPACCVSATAHLPLSRQGVDRRALAAARHAWRDVRFNPQRHLSDLPEQLLDRREALISASRRLRQPGRLNRADRRRVFDEIRGVNNELLRRGAGQVADLEQQWRRAEQQYRADLAALDREYFFALHPRSTMENLVERIGAAFQNG
jgi:hypothetical protein